MKVSPLSLGTIHFVGIGGIGMSGIAEILHALGQKVQGSDICENANVVRLRKKGIPIFIGHRADNIDDANLLVISSAIDPKNVEIVEAHNRKLSIVHRSEMLSQLARLKFSAIVSGSHGKTTTTSLISAIFDAAAMDPTVINGGIITSYGTNARLGLGDWMVIESDESDGSFMDLSPTVAIVTNIDPEHLDHYGSFEVLKESFRIFVNKIPFYGFAVLCVDHPVVESLIPMLPNKTIVTYGLKENAQVRASNIRVHDGISIFDVDIRLPQKPVIYWSDVTVPLIGEHNIQNVLAAVATAHKLEIPQDYIRKGLTRFEGVKRRFTKTGEIKGITIYDDYAHHPAEIQAVLKAARTIAKGKVIVVLQPHRFSRIKGLMDEFSASVKDADHVFISPIYAAGEASIPGITSEVLSEKMNAQGIKTQNFSDLRDLMPLLHPLLEDKDIVLFMGAGTVSGWANAFPKDFESYANTEMKEDKGIKSA